MTKEIEKNGYFYLIYTQILNSDDDTALRNSNETQKSCALTLSRFTLPTAEKLSRALLPSPTPFPTQF
jgi:hypothetical protein